MNNCLEEKYGRVYLLEGLHSEQVISQITWKSYSFSYEERRDKLSLKFC